MHIEVFAIVLLSCALAVSHPTMYKYNENRKLEADLIAVSSTVIPLPVYKVAYGVNFAPYTKDEKIYKPQGLITLLTSANYKKKAHSSTKQKDISIVKEVPNKF